MTKADTYQIITDRVLAKMAEGIVPWKQPWVGGEAPANFISKRPYRGVNVLMTMLAGYSQPYWLTFNQAKGLGGMVRKGERGTPLVLWKFLKKTTAEGKDETIPLIRYFTVFNVEQVDGIEVPPLAGPNVAQTDERAEALVQAFLAAHPGLTFEHYGDRACYSPTADMVRLPARAQFTSTSAYYSTLFHELVHATGHESRLKRDIKGFVMDPTSYSNEELTAEIGAAFLLALSGLEPDPTPSTVGYLQSWVKRLEDDKKAIVTAAGRAQRAVDLILGVSATSSDEGAEPAVQEAA